MEIKKVGVLGCGLMGAGIAQTCAAAGMEVVVREISDELCERGFKGIEKSLAKFAEKGTITAEQQTEIRARLFEPFVTGKPEGIGLGLAATRQIAETHGGGIRSLRIPPPNSAPNAPCRHQ